MFSHMACICHFVFLCPAQSLLCVYPVWVHSQCSLEVQLYFFQLFRCRNLALNRVFSYYLVVDMFFLYLGGCLDTPTFVCPHTFICPHIFVCPQGCTQPPISPPCSSVHLHGFGAFACCGGVVLCLNVCWDTSLTPPLFGGASPLITPPTLCYWFPVHCYFQG